MLLVGAGNYGFDVEFFAVTFIKGPQTFTQVGAQALQVVDIAGQIAGDAILVGRREVLDFLHSLI